MYFLLSGEGPTDMGIGVGAADICEGDDFLPGPMAAIVDQIVHDRCGYSPYGGGQCGFVSKKTLRQKEEELRPTKKSIRLPGKHIRLETRYFFTNARSLARIAKEKLLTTAKVVAVLFRDADTGNAGRGQWREKRNSMLHGFEVEGFDKGIPMIPKPKSEAWLICALKPNPYQNCDVLENRSASPKSPNDLKEKLERLLIEKPNRDVLCQKVKNRTIDYAKIAMPSFNAFKERLLEVIS